MNKAIVDNLNDGDPVPTFTGKVTTLWERKTFGQTQSQSGLVTFPDGSTYMLNLQSASAMNAVAEGQTYSFSGCTKGSGVSKSTGKPWQSIRVTNQSQMRLAGAGGLPSNSAQASAQMASTGGLKPLSTDQMASAFADIIVKTRDALVKRGIDPVFAGQMATGAPEWVALWWFGQKYPAPKAKPTAEAAAKKLAEAGGIVYDNALNYIIETLKLTGPKDKITVDQYKTASNVDAYKEYVAKQVEDDFNVPSDDFDDDGEMDNLPF